MKITRDTLHEVALWRCESTSNDPSSRSLRHISTLKVCKWSEDQANTLKEIKLVEYSQTWSDTDLHVPHTGLYSLCHVQSKQLFRDFLQEVGRACMCNMCVLLNVHLEIISPSLDSLVAPITPCELCIVTLTPLKICLLMPDFAPRGSYHLHRVALFKTAKCVGVRTESAACSQMQWSLWKWACCVD